MKLDLAKMQFSAYRGWVGQARHRGYDPLAYLEASDPFLARVVPEARGDVLHDLRLAARHHTAGTCAKGAFRLAGLPDPVRGTEMWSRVVYVCAPDLHEVEALRAVREAGSDAQEAVVSAYLLGGAETAELLILEVMTTPGGFFS